MKSALKVLAAVDRSPGAVRVVKHAIDVAMSAEAELHFLFVKVPYGEPYDKPVDVHRRLFIDEQLDLQDARGLDVEHSVVEADEVAPAICAYAEEHGCELIVVGTHGRRGLRRFVLGSVAADLLRTAPFPVFTVPAHDETEAGRNPFSHILVPFDFSDHAEYALEYAVHLAKRLNAEIELLHVVEDNFYPAFYGTFLHSIYESQPKIEELAREKMVRAATDAGLSPDRAKLTVIPGHAGSDIARHAQENSVDLIIMATHGLSGMAHLFMGSVAERTVQLARCPVVTTRMPVPGADFDSD